MNAIFVILQLEQECKSAPMDTVCRMRIPIKGSRQSKYNAIHIQFSVPTEVFI